jgi:GNAT superfamily N-acetyltransferase
MISNFQLEIHPLVPDCWEDFEKLFGSHGACGGCWCMYWKLARKEFIANQGEGNRLLQKKIIESGIIPGLLAYYDGAPVGWMAIEPRENYPVLARSRILKPVDEKKVTSITCFLVDKKFRNTGISTALVKAAVNFSKQQDVSILEGYPTDTQNQRLPAPFVYTGLASSFLNAGFMEEKRRSPKRPIMRYYLK